MRHTRLASFCALAIGLAAAAPASAQEARMDQLEQRLTQEFQRQFVGYSIAIARHGKVRRTLVSRLARRDADGRKEWGPRTRANVASVSKSITAIAVLQALEANGLTIEEPVAPYLPAGWARGRGFREGQSVTFRQLLTHTSGMGQRFDRLKANGNEGPWGNDWDGLRFAVGKGVAQRFLGPDKYAGENYSYKNSNYALFRIIVPKLWRMSQGGDGSDVRKANHGALFGLFAGEHIFAPSGVEQASCVEPPSARHAYAYDWTDSTGAGSPFNGSQENCGAHAGWRLSASHLARIAGRADCNSANNWPLDRRLLSQGACFARTVRKLGWDRTSNGSSDRTRNRYWHGGDLFSRRERPRRAIHSCMAVLPDGFSVGAIANSDSRDGETVCGKILDAAEFL
ncbi:serine hydrolase domain-containing protein [Novosphingobium beihaiensis]|uniref:Beta-lactamase family protein n=1 Tax=Novosphingobium beihaiensis TaxID=2930389 RepID=A0ABT0BTD9_9SPHN|nr:serine hydrolase domain-containing protein [Novosphingobium beihaiensis]MCJ2188297.1 beta-lactamase family protein [Novosphingobium beihaiensis]